MRRCGGRAIWWLLVLAAAASTRAQDLVPDQDRIEGSWFVDWKFFTPDDCAIVEGCILQSGYRKLLRFSSEVANVGTDQLELGDPASNPLFEWSECHGHFHFGEYAQHELLGPGGLPVAPGFKIGFCLLDSLRYIDEPWVATTPKYGCGFQGLQGGWADVYGYPQDCQWVDVTDVPNGEYALRVTVNPDEVLTEVDYSNNSIEIPVTIGDPPGIPHRPDGDVVPGQPLLASLNGANIRVVYDAATCPAQNYNLYYGWQTPIYDYAYDGAVCNLGTSGDVTVPLPDPLPGELVWFQVVGRNGAVEGGHGFDGMLVHRPLTGRGFCGISASQPAMGCGP